MHMIVPVMRVDELTGERTLSRYQLIERRPKIDVVVATHEQLGVLRKMCKRQGIVPMELEPGEEV